MLQCVTMVRFLRIFIKSGRKMVCSFEHIRLKFYSAFKAIYRRSKSADSQLVTVELIRSFCLPLITYGLEALNMRATDDLTLDNLLNNSLANIDRVILHLCSSLYVYRQLSRSDLLLFHLSLFY